MRKIFSRKVTEYEQSSGKHVVKYDDGDIETLEFSKEQWRRLAAEVNFSKLIDQIDEPGTNLNNPNEFLETIVSDPLDPRFLKSSRAEIRVVLERRSYVAFNRKDIPNRATNLNSRVQHSIKTNPDGSDKFKTRLMIQGHKEPYKGSVVSEAPTTLRSSIRLILTLNATFRFNIWSRDVKQAFLQSDFPLSRDLYIKPPNKPNLMQMVSHPQDTNLRALKPIYGLVE